MLDDLVSSGRIHKTQFEALGIINGTGSIDDTAMFRRFVKLIKNQPKLLVLQFPQRLLLLDRQH
jgi:hypothetical protein